MEIDTGSLAFATDMTEELTVASCLCLSAVQGNNEVSMWDMETGDRRLTLWASSAPPLSELQVCQRAAVTSVLSMLRHFIWHDLS